MVRPVGPMAVDEGSAPSTTSVSTTATTATKTNTETARDKFGIGEALLNDPKYGASNLRRFTPNWRRRSL